MNRYSRRSLVVALLLVSALLAGCAQTRAEPKGGGGSLYDQIRQDGVVRVGVRVDDPPHSFLDDRGDTVGFDIDIAKALARHWKVTLKLVPVDELTRISFLRNGKIDLAIASISKTRKRGEQVDFSQTYFFSVQTFLVRKGKVATLDDLVGRRVGADRGSSGTGNWTDWLHQHGHPGTPDVVQFGDKHAAVSAVKQGAIAGWAEDYEILASYATSDPSLTILSYPGGIGVKLDGVAMHKNDSRLTSHVNMTIQDLARSGEYDTIYDHWFGPGSQTPVPRQGTIEVWPNG